MIRHYFTWDKKTDYYKPLCGTDEFVTDRHSYLYNWNGINCFYCLNHEEALARQKKPASKKSGLTRAIQSKGGKSHSKEHMSKIGRLGGLKVSKDRAHMSRIGRLPKKKRKSK